MQIKNLERTTLAFLAAVLVTLCTGVAAQTAPEANPGPHGLRLASELEQVPLPPEPAATAALAGPIASLADALNAGWSESPQIQQAELALQATHFDISGARAGYYPYASVQTGGGTEYDYTVIRVIQPIWNGGLTGAQVDVAKAQQRIALAQLNKARLEIGLQIAETYLNIVLAQEKQARLNEYVSAMDQLRGVIQRRADEGVATQADVQTALTRLNQAAAARAANESALYSNRAQLARMLNRPIGEVSWPSDDSLMTTEEVRRATPRAERLHPERQLAEAQIALQKATADRSKAALWPEVLAQYSRQITGQVVDPSDESTALIVLQYQTNNGLAGYRSYQAERERLAATQATLETATRTVEAEIAVARAQWLAAKSQMELQQLAAESAVDLIDSFLRQFEAGRKTWLEVLNAQREANDTLLQQIAVRQSLWLANARLAMQTLYWRRLSAQAPDLNVIEE